MAPPSNYSASVRERLKNVAVQRRVDFNRLLERYVVERFLFRLGRSGEVNRFTLKGAAMLVVWAGKELRTTRDVDFLAAGTPTHDELRHSIAAICAVQHEEDGVLFDAESIRTEDIRETNTYHGIRATLNALIGSARVRFQIDVGFGDALAVPRLKSDYPVLLGHAQPRVWTYAREVSIAEKFEAMVKLGALNSRMKDFWDVAVLAREFEFDGATLLAAIEATFKRRGLELPVDLPEALDPSFYRVPQRVALWNGFLIRAQAQVEAPKTFEQAGKVVIAFLAPVRESLIARKPFASRWLRGGPWS
jgi:hypothetical protein